jgi:hypothetical protein
MTMLAHQPPVLSAICWQKVKTVGFQEQGLLYARIQGCNLIVSVIVNQFLDSLSSLASLPSSGQAQIRVQAPPTVFELHLLANHVHLRSNAKLTCSNILNFVQRVHRDVNRKAKGLNYKHRASSTVFICPKCTE